MMISRDLADAMNQQIGHEYGASLQYVGIASYFDRRKLKLLSKLFFDQAEEEKQHALKFVRYLLDTQADVRVPAIPAPKPTFPSAEAAVQAALEWEKEVTAQINLLMDRATSEKDYLAQGFLQWFVDEQLEEVRKMDQLLGVVQQAGEKNLLLVEAYLVHLEKGE
jgi:ferritin